MIRTTVTTIASAAALFAVSKPFDPPIALADSTRAYCTLSWHDDSMDMIKGPCGFSQHQGNVYVYDFNWYKFAFPAADDGKTYIRQSTGTGLSFNREGEYTLNVFWDKPGNKLQAEITQSFPLKCQLNEIASTCRTEPNQSGGFVLFFSHGDQPMFDLTPISPATIDRRVMVDSTGTRWSMSGHQSFILEEINGFGNSISVNSP